LYGHGILEIILSGIMAFYAATVRGLCREVAFRFSVVEQVKKRD